LDLMKDFFLEANPNPERIGCPEERTLRALAEDRLPAADPARLHLASCSECFAEFRGFRGDWERSRKARRRIIGWAVAASLIVASGIGTWEYQHSRAAQIAAVQMAAAKPVNANVDLFNAGTVRGEDDDANALNQVSLPAAMFPGMIGVDVANEISKAVVGLGQIRGLIIDLRGNTGGGAGVSDGECIRVAFGENVFDQKRAGRKRALHLG
jgi:hypothetical protein